MDEITLEENGRLSRVFEYVCEHKLKTLAFLVSATGAFCVASMDYGVQVVGFELWLFSNVSWILIGIEEDDYPLMMTFSVYFMLNIWGTMARWGWC